MNRELRPIPYPRGSEARRHAVANYMHLFGPSYRQALKRVSAPNLRARYTPVPGEKCGALTLRGTPCHCG
jgi:hypothetical protein